MHEVIAVDRPGGGVGRAGLESPKAESQDPRSHAGISDSRRKAWLFGVLAVQECLGAYPIKMALGFRGSPIPAPNETTIRYFYHSDAPIGG
jgi:hypothetical protein